MKKYLAIFLYIFNLNCMYFSNGYYPTNPQIIVASLHGNYNQIVQEVNNGVSVDTRGVDNSTALMNAAAHGSGDIVVFLVENGANLDLTDNNNQTAFDKAILHNQEDIAEFLELHKDDPEFSRKATNLRFFTAIRKNDLKTLSEILNNGLVDVNQTNKWGNTPLKIALTHLNYKMIKLLVDHGADLEAKDKHGKTILDHAIEQAHLPTMKMLIEAGANVEENQDAINKLEKEVAQQEFLKALNQNDIQKVTQLLETGLINTNKYNTDGTTPLEKSLTFLSTDMAKLLIKYGADLEAEDDNGHTFLDRAIEAKNLSKIKTLVNLGANTQNRIDRINDLYKAKAQKEFFEALGQLNLQKINELLETGLVDIEGRGYAINYNSRLNHNYNAQSALEYAISQENLDLIELLVEANASTKNKIEQINNLRQKRIQKNLFEAISSRNIQRVTQLLESGAIDLTQPENNALPWAIYYNSIEIIKLLVQHGANLEEKNNNGQTALDYVLSRNALPIVETLIELGADTQNRTTQINNLRQKTAENDFYNAIQQNDIQKVSRLLESDSININEKAAVTGFIDAAHKEYVDIMKLLVEKGINLETTDAYGKTAFEYALRGNKHNSVKYLLKAGAKPKVRSYELVNGCFNTRIIEEVIFSPQFDINSFDELNNETLLMQAIRKDKKELVKLILKHPKLNVNLKNKNGKTALDIADDYGINNDIIKLLLTHPNIDLSPKSTKSLRKETKHIIEKVAKTKKEKLSKKVATVKAKKAKPKKR